MKEKQVTTKERIVEVAQELFFSQGFGATPVEQIIRTLDIAKGTFYHHFTGKNALLDEIIERYAQDVFAAVQPIVDSDELSAPEKLAAFMKQGFSWKMGDRRTPEIMRIYYASGNALLREKLSTRTIQSAALALAPIIHQGVSEGVYRTPIPDRVAGLIWRISTSLSQEMGQLLLSDGGVAGTEAGAETGIETGTIAEIEALISDMEYAFERLLDAPVGSVTVLDRDDIHKMVEFMGGAVQAGRSGQAPHTAGQATQEGAQV